ncbi:hypothetical protein Peur_042995 [Populus x canadensis]
MDVETATTCEWNCKRRNKALWNHCLVIKRYSTSIMELTFPMKSTHQVSSMQGAATTVHNKPPWSPPTSGWSPTPGGIEKKWL